MNYLYDPTIDFSFMPKNDDDMSDDNISVLSENDDDMSDENENVSVSPVNGDDMSDEDTIFNLFVNGCPNTVFNEDNFEDMDEAFDYNDLQYHIPMIDSKYYENQSEEEEDMSD